MSAGVFSPPPDLFRDMEVVEWADRASWEEFVLDAGDSTVAHRWAWLDAITETYGHRVFALACVRGGQLVGVLPLVLIRSRLFGRHLVSMPFLDTGGACTAGDRRAERTLVAAALSLATDTSARLELRHRSPRPIRLEAATHKVTMALELSDQEVEVWQRIKSNRRGQVRKALRNGLEVSIEGADATEDFFRVMATNMRDLGSPVHRRTLFRRAVEALGEDARFVIVRDAGCVVGAGMVLVHQQRAVLPYSSSVRASFSRGTNQLLYWGAIRYAIERGCTVFDFGRSSPGSGTFEAKREWGAGAEQLYWYRYPFGRGQQEHDDTQRLLWASAVWRRLPVPVATSAAHFIRGSLPQ